MKGNKVGQPSNGRDKFAPQGIKNSTTLEARMHHTPFHCSLNGRSAVYFQVFETNQQNQKSSNQLTTYLKDDKNQITRVEIST
jgi:hypothetical protein